MKEKDIDISNPSHSEYAVGYTAFQRAILEYREKQKWENKSLLYKLFHWKEWRERRAEVRRQRIKEKMRYTVTLPPPPPPPPPLLPWTPTAKDVKEHLAVKRLTRQLTPQRPIPQAPAMKPLRLPNTDKIQPVSRERGDVS